MLTNDEINNTIANYTNTQDLIDTIRQMQQDMAVVKSAAANVIDYDIGSVSDRDIAHLANRYQVTPAMATVMIQACNETSENNAYSII